MQGCGVLSWFQTSMCATVQEELSKGQQRIQNCATCEHPLACACARIGRGSKCLYCWASLGCRFQLICIQLITYA